MKHSRNAVTKGILGPWHHSMTTPGPLLDWGGLRVRWFDHWLNANDTGLMEEPRASFYLPRWQRQSFRYAGEVPGEWRHIEEWPQTVFDPGERLYFRPEPGLGEAQVLASDPSPGEGGSLSDASGPPSALRLRYYPATGGRGQSFGPTRGEGYYGIDHRSEDVWGLSFDTPPLREPLEILGFALARLFVSSTAPTATWIVRLQDVAPGGTSYQVARGYLNGTHRSSHTRPEALVPGEVYEIEVELMCTGYRFDEGHRVRVVVTNADFPTLWPSPYPMTTSLYTGGHRASHVLLPVLPSLAYRTSAVYPPVLDPSPRPSPRDRNDGESWYRLIHDVEGGTHTAEINLPRTKMKCRVNENDPAIASLEVSGSREERAWDRSVEVRSEGVLRSTATQFILDIECTLLESGEVIRSRRWKDEVRRELV